MVVGDEADVLSDLLELSTLCTSRSLLLVTTTPAPLAVAFPLASK